MSNGIDWESEQWRDLYSAAQGPIVKATAGNPRRDEIEVAAILIHRIGLSPGTAAAVVRQLSQEALYAICWESDYDEWTTETMNRELAENADPGAIPALHREEEA